jgi:uncharacterized protein YrrD
MLSKAKTLKGYSIQTTDDETIGKVKEFYFDDQYWTVRYLVANTGTWLSVRQVLISPYALVAVNTDRENIVVELTKKQIEDSPSLDSDKPVSRQFETEYYGYYKWQTYWSGSCAWGDHPHIVRDRKQWEKPVHGEKAWDPHLRSTQDVSGHHVQATDGQIGHIEDFIIDCETWAIRYLIAGTLNWWPGKKVLISPQWIKRISWSEKKVFVNLSRETIKQSPEYTEETLLTRDYEAGLHRHYNRQGYWVDELAAK